ncbi:HGGxSTG domain-containing protein [Shewanella marisflavi]|uniref:HGGxSTG domain-containing protein n=1 Tax=Shewanella marisflavi TaxID=260364 RepID=UPI003AAE4051
MTKFSLDSLPKCGAKTRSGKPCQRYGNKTNGRCKLHGGRSTGPKTKQGKLTVRANPIVHSVVWHVNNVLLGGIKKEDAYKAVNAYLMLGELCDNGDHEAYGQAMAIIQDTYVELEMLKYSIANYEGAVAFLLIQSALDHYYKESGSKHLFFHVHTALSPPSFFKPNGLTKTQHQEHMRWDIRSMRKRDFSFNSRVREAPHIRAWKKQFKKRQRAIWDDI